MSTKVKAAASKDASTLRQIAELAGTSKSTVSRVLTNHPRISQRTRDRVLAVIKKHHYHPNLFARALAGGRTGLVGVLSSNISSGFFAEVIRGVDIAANRQRGHLVVSIAHGIDDYLRLFDELLENGQVDGLILIDPPLELFARALPSGHIPLVLCASRPPARARSWSGVDSVTVDNTNAMQRIVRHLQEQRFDYLVHLAGPRNVYDAQQRRAAFEQAVKHHNVCRWEILDGHLIQDDGRSVIQKRFSDPSKWPEAFVCFNDSVAFGVVAEINRLATTTQTPAVTGWDSSPASTVLNITSVEMPLTGLGEMTARLLLDRVQDETGVAAPARQVVLDMELKIRASSQIH